MVFSLTWLPEVLEQAGLKVAETPEWRTRGRAEMGQVRGVMCHHTATLQGGNMPSLKLLIDGRSDLSGPLAQLGLGRDGTFYVIAAGRANHAGPGRWEGLTSGNSSFIGIEAENNGRNEKWPTVQIDAYQRGVAAILKKIGAGANMCCGHKEYALPAGRKQDPDFDMAGFRNQVAALLAGKTPPPLIPAADEQRRPTLRRGATGPFVLQAQQVLGLDPTGSFDAKMEAALRAFQRDSGLVPDGILGPKSWERLAPPPAPSVRIDPVVRPATLVAFSGEPGLPPADDPQHPPRLVGKKALGPDNKPFASTSHSGFYTPGDLSLEEWIKSLPEPPVAVAAPVLRAVTAMCANEGGLDAINSYDNAHLSFGVFQWTAGQGDAPGELAVLLAKFKSLDADGFKDCFGQYGLDVIAASSSAAVGLLSLNGQILRASAQKDTLRSIEWAYRFWRGGHHPSLRLAQIAHAASRIDLFKNRSVAGQPLTDWLSSELGVALVLDEHVNRPGHVPGTLARAIQALGIGANTDLKAWTSAQEHALIDHYLAERANTDMTDSEKRAARIADYVRRGKLSDARGSFSAVN